MLGMGIVVALGILVMLIKLSWRKKMWVLSHALIVDVVIFILVSAIHWGTFSGLMVAAVAALFTSITLSIGSWLVGHVKDNRYYPGVFNVVHKLRD
jgi:hypothetical protein